MKGKFFVFSLENCDNGAGCQLIKLSHQIEVSKQLWFKEPSLKQPVHIVLDSVLYQSDTLQHKIKKDTNLLHQKAKTQ